MLEGGVAAVLEARANATRQPDHLIGGAEQQGAGIAGDAPPSNDATTARPSTGANPNRSGLHSVGIGALLCSAIRLCCRRTFADPGPDHITPVRDAG